jgi:hypothetical protein
VEPDLGARAVLPEQGLCAKHGLSRGEVGIELGREDVVGTEPFEQPALAKNAQDFAVHA